MPLARPALCVALVAALALAACGGSSGPELRGEERAVADAVKSLGDAGQRGDARKICEDLLARSLRDRMRAAQVDCIADLEGLLERADAFRLEVRDVSVSGTTARASVSSREDGEDRPATLELVREDGRWRLSDLGQPAAAG